MKINTKLILGFLIVALLVGVMGYISLRQINMMGEAFEEVTEDATPVLNSLVHLKHAQDLFKLEILRYIIFSSKEGRDKFQEALKHFRENKNEIIKREGTEGGKWQELISALEEYERRITTISQELFDLKDQGALEGVSLSELLQTQESESLETMLEEILEDRIEYEQKELKERQETVVTTTKEAQRNIIAFNILIVLLGVGLAFFISRSISKPITKLKDIADKISKGNLEEPIEVKSRDEIGELARSFDNMRYSLKMIIDEYEKQKSALDESKQELEKKVKERTIDLEKSYEGEKKKSEQLERFSKLAIGREDKMIELKKRIKELEKQVKKKGEGK